MKKNFFKKLSFVLALAMIVSVLAPAAGVLAASKPKLNSTKQYLFLGQTNKYDFNISNKKSGWSYKWTSSNKAVATVASNGVTTGKSIGTAEVSVVIKDKDGEEVAELTADVIVKDSIKTVKISNGPAEGKMLVGAEFDFNRSFTTYGGSTKKTTSVTKWTVDSDKATISTSGVFKATEAGEYTVTARSFQSTAKYNAWVKDASAVKTIPTDTFKVTVVASMETPVQVDIDTVKVPFTTAMTDVAKNISVYQLVGTTKVKQLVKEVKMDDAKKVAEVTLYVPFAAEATYVIEYTGMDAVQFKAATTKAEDVTSIKIDTKTVVINPESGDDVKVYAKLFNKDGVDITTTDLYSRVDLTSAGEVNTWFDTATDRLSIFVKGATATITAVYHTWNYDTNTGDEIGTLKDVAVITGVDKASQVVNGIKAWTMTATAGDANFKDVKQKLAVGDSKSLYVQLNTKTGSDDGTVDNKAGDAGNFEFESSDKTVLMINGNALIPVKAGTATIVVKYGTGDDKVAVGAFNVTVSAERIPASLTFSANSFVLSNSFADTKTVELTVKDQLGDEIDSFTYDIDFVSGPANTLIDDSQTSGDIVVDGNTQAVGTYTYKVTVDKISRVIVVTVKAPTGTAATDIKYYTLEVGSATKDIKVANDEVLKNVTFHVYAMASNGVRIAEMNITNTANVAGEFNIAIDASNADETDYAAGTLPGVDTYALVKGGAAVASGTAIDKVELGSYKVTAYRWISNTVKTAVASEYFQVTDTQVKPVLAETDTLEYSSANSADEVAAVAECFDFTLDGANVDTDILDVEYVGYASSKYIKKVFIKQTFTQGGTTYVLTHEVAVNQLIQLAD